MAETRRNFALKLIALFKRGLEEKIITGRIRDQELREEVLLWEEIAPGKHQPLFYAEVRLLKPNLTLVCISFERFDEGVADFEVLDDLSRSTSVDRTRMFDSNFILSVFPAHPILSKSLLTDEDVEIRVLNSRPKGAEDLKEYKYSYGTDSLVEIKASIRPGMADVLKSYATQKIKSDLDETLKLPKSIVEGDKLQMELLESITNPGETPKQSVDELQALSKTSKIEATNLYTSFASKAALSKVTPVISDFLKTPKEGVLSTIDQLCLGPTQNSISKALEANLKLLEFAEKERERQLSFSSFVVPKEAKDGDQYTSVFVYSLGAELRPMN